MIALAVRVPIGIGALLVAAGSLALIVRARVEREPERRLRYLVIGALQTGVAVALFAWLPRYGPETSGSPSALVFQIAIWMFCALLGLAGVAMFAGAALAGPPRGDDGEDDA